MDPSILKIVIQESKDICQNFELWISDNVEKDFPEGMGSIQERRLLFKILLSEKHKIEELAHSG